ncbi:class II aldolase/adducin family protein [Nocardioides panacis]|uniref:Class II aldolase/adducin family protein n=1 Tax=Nocardioides panacis TaxID=2849501 RepID=A0A975T249_9ACTN|nr:class II aldolase/adducin family protein [Nocardioides panacis]QWZ10151.1 class II aldolase/adducin family protein [Nocardioides panacis]
MTTPTDVAITEATLRRDVAACSRLLVAEDILNYSGHVSARLPGRDAFLIQRTHDVRAFLDPERLLVVDFDGVVEEGDGKPPSERFIHAEIYKARQEAQSVAHFHHDPTTIFAAVPTFPLVPVKNHFARWVGGIPVHRDSSHIDNPEKGRQVVETLADRDALLLRGHGQVLLAESVRAVFIDAVHLVENAGALTLAAQLATVEPLSQAELDHFLETFDRPKHVEKLWKYYAQVAAARGVIPAEWI